MSHMHNRQTSEAEGSKNENKRQLNHLGRKEPVLNVRWKHRRSRGRVIGCDKSDHLSKSFQFSLENVSPQIRGWIDWNKMPPGLSKSTKGSRVVNVWIAEDCTVNEPWSDGSMCIRTAAACDLTTPPFTQIPPLPGGYLYRHREPRRAPCHCIIAGEPHS